MNRERQQQDQNEPFDFRTVQSQRIKFCSGTGHQTILPQENAAGNFLCRAHLRGVSE
jgi:hypothetical protein